MAAQGSARVFFRNVGIILGKSFAEPTITTVLPSAPPGEGRVTLQGFDLAGGGEPPPHTLIQPYYKYVLIGVATCTLLAGIAQIYMAVNWTETLTAAQASVFDTMGAVWKMGFGAFVGMLGGKAG